MSQVQHNVNLSFYHRRMWSESSTWMSCTREPRKCPSSAMKALKTLWRNQLSLSLPMARTRRTNRLNHALSLELLFFFMSILTSLQGTSQNLSPPNDPGAGRCVELVRSLCLPGLNACRLVAAWPICVPVNVCHWFFFQDWLEIVWVV